MTSIKSYDFYYQLRTLPFVDGIWLYGSRAKQLAAKTSDIDLAIVCPNATAEDWRRVLTIIDEADTLLAIDCIRFDTLTDERLKTSILNEKETLFERVENTFPWYETFLDLGEAIDRLGEMVNEPLEATTYVKDATIHRFEFTVELFWKLLKKLCREQGVEVNSPKATLKQAFTMQFINEETLWLDMMEDRNLISHTYKPPVAKEIYSHIKQYYTVMKKTYEKLRVQYQLILRG